MIKSCSVEKQTPYFRILSQDQIQEIKWAAYDIMAKVGFKVLHSGARRMLKAAGCIVKDAHVRVPEHVVRECVRLAPKGWTIYDRSGKRALEVQGRKSYYGTATASPNTKNALTGEVHPTTLNDIAMGAKVADALEHIDFVMPFGSSQDVPGQAIEIYEFPAVVANTIKPQVFIGYSGRGVELVYEMAAAVAGGLDRLQERPFVMAYPEPITPLVYPANVCDRLFAAADLSMPQISGATVQLGATGPVTIAGAAAHGIAEGLMALVLSQLRKPGCPVALSVNIGVLDMSTALMTFGDPTNSLGLCVHAEVAQSFGLPTWGLAGATDAKVIDAQAGVESTFHIFAQALAGLNLIHDVGYMDSAMTCSAEQMLLGNEVIGMVKHFMRGVTVNRETLARQVMEDVGPSGHFLDHTHTFNHFRSQLLPTRLFDRKPRSVWEKNGAKRLDARIHEATAAIIESHQPESLDDKVVQELERIKAKGVSELVPNVDSPNNP